jgi:hypothetical protein
MKRISTILVIALVAVMALPLVAAATGIEAVVGMKEVRDKSGTVKISLEGNPLGDPLHVYNEAYTAQLRDADGNLMNDGEWFQGFCVDLYHWAKIGGVLDVDFVKPSEVEGGLHAAWILENRDSYNPPHAEWSDYELGGLQLAIWEVTNDYSETFDYDLYAGTFEVLTNTAVDQTEELAAFYLNQLALYFDPTGLDDRYLISQNPDKQNVIWQTGDPVPEPSTMLLLGLGVAGIAWLKRRKRL